MSHAPNSPTLPSVEAPPEQQAQPARCALATGYAPMVGDRFHKPAWNRKSPLDADPVPMPEQNAVVTMMSPGHVVVLIDGEEYTMPTGDFVRIAENTLKHGSTLTRSA